MNDEVVRLSMIGQVLRRRWLALAALGIVGALAGAAASLVLSPGYKATSQILLPNQEAEADSRAQAQLVTSSTVLDRTRAALGWDVSSGDLRDMVDATVSDGALLEITGAADTPQAARRLSNQVATEYITFATELIATTTDAATQLRLQRLDELAQQVEATNDQLDELHQEVVAGELTLQTVRTGTELEALRKDLANAMARLERETAVPAEKQPLIIDPATLPSKKAAPTQPQLIGSGAGVFLLVGVFGFLLAARGDARLRDADELSAALGVPVTGTIAVPDDHSWRWRRPAADDDDGATDPQCHRVLSRLALATGDALRLLLVAADDDPLARRAVARLAMAAGDARHTVVRIAHIDPAAPALDGSGDVTDAVLVLSPGTRTGWDLVGIATACADAGHPLRGSVLARQVKPSHRTETLADEVVAADRDDSMAGSS